MWATRQAVTGLQYEPDLCRIAQWLLINHGWCRWPLRWRLQWATPEPVLGGIARFEMARCWKLGGAAANTTNNRMELLPRPGRARELKQLPLHPEAAAAHRQPLLDR